MEVGEHNLPKEKAVAFVCEYISFSSFVEAHDIICMQCYRKLIVIIEFTMGSYGLLLVDVDSCGATLQSGQCLQKQEHVKGREAGTS